MDKNKFWLGGRLFNTAPPRLGAPTQRKARSQDGHPNKTQDTSASLAPQCNARHARKLVAPMQCKARPQVGRPTHVRNANTRHVYTSVSWAHQCNARQVRKLVTPMHFRNANARHVRMLGAPTQRKARPQDGCPNAMQGASARWVPKRNARYVRKMGAQTKN